MVVLYKTMPHPWTMRTTTGSLALIGALLFALDGPLTRPIPVHAWTSHPPGRRRRRPSCCQAHKDTIEDVSPWPEADHNRLDRRAMLQASALVVSGLAVTTTAPATTHAEDTSLTNLCVGKGSWQSLSAWSDQQQQQQQQDDASSAMLSPAFVTYGTRFLLNYDAALTDWWNAHINSSTNINHDPVRAWSLLASALGREWQRALISPQSAQQLYDSYVQVYADNDEALRQINLWFALLPPSLQPTQWKDDTSNKISTKQSTNTATIALDSFELFDSDYTALLPPRFRTERDAKTGQTRIVPPLPRTLSTDKDDNDTIVTLFGPLPSSWTASTTSTILTRETPVYGPQVYTLLGLAGATGCALTHATVIPLDVVKTRAQTDTSGQNLLQQAQALVEQQGLASLFLGTQATIAGYLWYGASVYPAYTFSKRWLTSLVADWGSSGAVTALPNADVIALMAGALAAVVASLGLTPLEAARIRAVADPERYAEPGLVGTLQVLANEEALYAGLPSLLTRQVIFGSVKFLAFERFAEAMALASPGFLGDPDFSWLLSLLAGGMSGAVSAFISQPADSLLTYVAAQDKQKDSKGATANLIVGLQALWKEGGPGALFRGLGSRSVWAGSIIAGQFFLYDIFRTMAGVSSADLTQVWNYQLNLN